MKKFNCPSCGAEVVFHSNVAVYAVCAYCSSMIVRHDVDVESIGVMAALPDDMSPLQLGTSGFYRKQAFTLVGRMKIAWKFGSWNEWFAFFENGSRGWLAEAQGTYAFSFEMGSALPTATVKKVDELITLHNSQSVKTSSNDSNSAPQTLGTYLVLDKQKYKIVDIKKAVCAGSEGELPFSAPHGRRTVSLDMLGPSGEFACIELDGTKTRCYLGNYVEWDELKCTNLRELEGW